MTLSTVSELRRPARSYPRVVVSPVFTATGSAVICMLAADGIGSILERIERTYKVNAHWKEIASILVLLY